MSVSSLSSSTLATIDPGLLSKIDRRRRGVAPRGAGSPSRTATPRVCSSGMVAIVATLCLLASPADVPTAASSPAPSIEPSAQAENRDFLLNLFRARKQDNAAQRTRRLLEYGAEFGVGIGFLLIGLFPPPSAGPSDWQRVVALGSSGLLVGLSLDYGFSTAYAALTEPSAQASAAGTRIDADWAEWLRSTKQMWAEDQVRREVWSWIGLGTAGGWAGLSTVTLVRSDWSSSSVGPWVALSSSVLWLAIELYRAWDAYFRPSHVQQLLDAAG